MCAIIFYFQVFYYGGYFRFISIRLFLLRGGAYALIRGVLVSRGSLLYLIVAFASGATSFFVGKLNGVLTMASNVDRISTSGCLIVIVAVASGAGFVERSMFRGRASNYHDYAFSIVKYADHGVPRSGFLYCTPTWRYRGVLGRFSFNVGRLVVVQGERNMAYYSRSYQSGKGHMSEVRVQGCVGRSHVSKFVVHNSLFLFLESRLALLLYASTCFSGDAFSVELGSGSSSLSHYFGNDFVRGVLRVYAYGSYYYSNGLDRVCVLSGEFILNVGTRSFLSSLRVQASRYGLAIGASQARGYEVRSVRTIDHYRRGSSLVRAGTVRLCRGLIRYLLSLVVSTTRANSALSYGHVSLVGRGGA